MLSKIFKSQFENKDLSDINQRSTNVSIEKWLKTKFREGFKELQKAFKEQDPKSVGRIKRKGLVYFRKMCYFNIFIIVYLF